VEIIAEHVKLLGNGYFNFYVVGEQEAALVECGTRATASILTDQWASLDKKPDVRYILAMHSHFDHACGLPVLKKLFPEAQIVGSRLAQKLLSRERIVHALFHNDEILTENYARAQLIEAKPTEPAPAILTVDLVVGEGDELSLGQGLSLRFLDMPGHSICSIAAYLEQDQCMFVSDATGVRYADGSLTSAFFINYSDYIASIRKLMPYPTRVIGPGHGPVVQGEDTGDYYQRALDESQRLFEYVREQLQQGVSETDLARDLFKRYIKDGLALYPADLMMESMYLRIKCVKAEI
jgi:glyoxylase-like metal-dependent hydrolase (beta-lactamase superfamily II)